MITDLFYLIYILDSFFELKVTQTEFSSAFFPKSVMLWRWWGWQWLTQGYPLCSVDEPDHETPQLVLCFISLSGWLSMAVISDHLLHWLERAGCHFTESRNERHYLKTHVCYPTRISVSWYLSNLQFTNRKSEQPLCKGGILSK